ncbi:DUF4237 domain-containing protein [Mycobacterium simiae]|uniref:DUF4237 domain-containing protein n=1 Tax=Mycobacterium simiae TaxID=1784 RepID=A0A5B1BJ36_MYCSI|nr:glycohydrolase toxin TNT-related protein [Mycobacterium simiae]KAA1248677.1 DUF4237 domain-containing protein [Mycobacterium simiae]
MEDANAPFGRDPNGHAYAQQEYQERFNKLGPNGEHWFNFPGNNGAVPGTRVAYTDIRQFIQHYGNRLDRIGDDQGSYFGVMENGHAASWEQRALHVKSLRDPYHAYALNLLPAGWKIEISEVAPGLGQRGGGLQVQIIDAAGEARTEEELVVQGILR